MISRKRKCNILMITIVAGLMIMSGCGKEETETLNTDDSFKSVAENNETVVLPEGVNIVTEYSEVSEEQSFNSETDDQLQLENESYAAETDASVYFLDYYLYVYDKENKTKNILCNKAECNHTDPEICNGILGNAQGLYYYNGYLYTVMEDSSSQGDTSEKSIDMVKISLDGSTRDKVFNIASAYISDDSLPDNCFSVWGIQHRGYFYYVYNFGTGGGTEESFYYNNNSNILYRVKMDGTEKPQCLMVMQSCGNVGCMNMRGYGSYVYFADTGKDAMGELYRYNTESNKIEKIDLGVVDATFYTIIDGKIIYKQDYTSNEFYYYDEESRSAKLYCSLDEVEGYTYRNLNYDGKYIFASLVDSDERKKWGEGIYDKKLNFIQNKMVTEEDENMGSNCMTYIGRGGDFLWLRDSLEDGEICVFEKN